MTAVCDKDSQTDQSEDPILKRQRRSQKASEGEVFCHRIITILVDPPDDIVTFVLAEKSPGLVR